MPGGEAADDGVAGPAQRGDAEQDVRLVGKPSAGRGGARGWIGSRHAAVVLDPVRTRRSSRPSLTPGRNFARRSSQTRIFANQQWAGCIATMRGAVGVAARPAASAVAAVAKT